MKQILSIIALVILFISCSSNNNSEINQIESPSISNISTEIGNVGDIFTISGKNFNPKINYKVQINGIDGIITEISSTFIKVKIPDGATSGNIVLLYDKNSTVIGNIKINITKVYGYKYFGAPSGNSSEKKQIVEIDKANGSSKIIATLNINSTYLENLVFDSSTNKIIGIYDVDDRNVSQSLLTVDLANGNTSIINLNNVGENSKYAGLLLNK
ncbi:IPT/TIG domain-containing protein [Flavobacterium ammonificans]|uniref:IPT/TIG domain-containing protein n=1 Tax=Flavobacterium ammonificans TaxID=1751056 RepID=A0ABM7UY87_9FLAO|nr:IPT/TIG domain-containing protein [Flavobacterium ammonificans]BDB52047.1 hypothetical protein GENT11_03590 [Flavobacterium ammonificans]